LKAENILIDHQGYPILIDFGFAKMVLDKTYTLCGTPLYLPPEVILNRGHNQSADHWSLGVLIYEMLFGDTPFYSDGMQQMDLFRAIVKGKFVIPTMNKMNEPVSANVASILKGFLSKSPAQRLGSLVGGEDDVLEHEWFANPIPGSSDEVIDFASYRNKLIGAPTIPKIRNPLDASNFEDWSHVTDKTKTYYPDLTHEQKKIFENF
jgi:serine/threonine protein kinase